MQKKRILYWVTIALLSLVILVCAVMIGHKLITDAQQRNIYSELLETMPSVERPPIPTGTEPSGDATSPSETEPVETQPQETEPEEIPTLLDPVTGKPVLYPYMTLYTTNNDMVGFIDIPGTDIRYPVLQTKDEPNYYLNRNFYKQWAACGAIYVREACDVNDPSDNVTLYGHRMIDGSMFSDLHLYKREKFFKNNRYIHFDTLTEYHTYEIFAVFQTEANHLGSFNYHLFDDAANEEEFDRFVSKCKELAYYDTGITPKFGDKLITLSTCDRSIEDGRLVVVARRVM